MIWLALLFVLIAGTLNKVINALLTDNGFILPMPKTTDGQKIWLPGILGNVILGGVGAVVSWGLYGPVSAVTIFGSGSSSAPSIALTLSALVGAVLVGAAGARWWSSEVDKKLLQTATGKAAAAKASPDVVAKIMAASPQKAFDIASSL